MTVDLAALKSYPYQGDEGLAALVELINQSNKAEGINREVVPEYVRQFINRPDVELVQLWENSEGLLLAAVTFRVLTLHIAEGHSLDVQLLLNVHPAGRGQGLEKQLIAWSVEWTRRFGKERNLPAWMSWRIEQGKTEQRDWLESSGFEIVRYFFTMEHLLAEPLPASELPPGFILRDSASTNPQAWADLYNNSFIDHWHHHAITVREVEHETTNPTYQPEIDLAAVGPDGSYAALCYCRINPGEMADEKRVGWIGLLGTRRGFRNLGLGRGLMLEGMDRMQAAGVERVRLTVDADSLTGATRLYEAVGFRVCQTYLHYSRKVL